MTPEEKALALEQKIADLEKTAKDNVELKAELDAAKADLAEMKEKLDSIEIKDHTPDFEKINKDLNDIAEKIKNFKQEKTEPKDLNTAINEMVASDGYKEFLQDVKDKKFKGTKTFEVKVDTGDITGTVGRTQVRPGINIAPNRAMAFLPRATQLAVDADRDRVLWTEGTYTSNAGYATEITALATEDSGTATERSRQMAKVGAFIKLSGEMLEDASFISNAFRARLNEHALLFADQDIYNGPGADTNATTQKQIYGIVSQSTQFNLADASGVLEDSVANPNIGDLIDAVITQAEIANQFGLNTVWMHPADVYKFKTTKDNDGNRIFVQDVNGVLTVRGLEVVSTTAVTANSMLVADASKLYWYWKRNVEVKFGQFGNDAFADQYSAILFMRGQVVIEQPDRTAFMAVDDIAANLTLLASP